MNTIRRMTILTEKFIKIGGIIILAMGGNYLTGETIYCGGENPLDGAV